MGRHPIGDIANDHQGRGAVLSGTLGLDADGNFVALSVQWLVNLGAYCSKNGPFINTMASPRSMSNNLYKLPALFGLHKLILTNCAPGTAYRGPAAPMYPISGNGWSMRRRGSPASTG